MQNRSYDCFINGQWLPAHSCETLEVTDPANGDVLAHIARAAARDVDDAVQAARAACNTWAGCPPVQRARILYAIAQRIAQEKEHLAELESRDTGKPLKQAMADAVAAARFFEYYAGVADKVLGTSIPLGNEYFDFTVREALGVTAQIVPWNYPLQIASRGLAPALATGNTVVLKPAELACLSVLELTRICHEAGLPAGVLNVVPGYGYEAGAALAAHPDVNLIVFTGSVATGVAVMQAAAQNIVPVLLELGGKSPNIVLADADLDEALPVILRAAYPNSGQTCSAGSRVLVQRSVHRELAGKLDGLNRNLRVGPGLQDPDIGPLISGAQQRKVLDYIEIGRSEGAEVLDGGNLLAGLDGSRGNYVMPTILDSAAAGMRVHREEIFGPVLTIVPFDDIEEAAALANSTDYGLVAGIWGKDGGAINWLAQHVKAGQVFVNCYGAGGGVELPFGGYKKSGFGREKGMDALLSYTQVKNICFRIPSPRA
ncbi:aldehyde dehydrogenase family protein [Pollutimonas bauzanensis]|uniref:Aldehyde dehydrogenase (NAD+) n=1 Tax=Pollutimonas bauzanensis TaxID=658167 RepID=A0A1M6ALH4_9BURK|nr:aldehyde dehydrogenase family protein [Pollutimonas bauzanensis]SHI37267.1 aldehyde dehydrogenase (NAD+) [Pollutimonas bauzanensis]